MFQKPEEMELDKQRGIKVVDGTEGLSSVPISQCSHKGERESEPSVLSVMRCVKDSMALFEGQRRPGVKEWVQLLDTQKARKQVPL